MVAGFMGVTALLSMWVSNTATALMMVPIAASVLGLAGSEGRRRELGTCLMLSVAYGASLGGMGTLIGTPPNLFLASYARDHLGYPISFAGWLTIGIPLVAIFLPLAWYILTHLVFSVGRDPIPGIAELLQKESAGLGPMNQGEKATLGVFVLAVAAWILQPFLPQGVTDTTIALGAAALLFVIPVRTQRWGFVMNLKTARRIPWGILLLFGGGLSLGAAIEGTGVAAYLGYLVSGLNGLPPLVVVAAVTTVVIFLTEVTSNSATAATLIPIFAGVAPGLGIEPTALAVPTALAASCAFMLPVATPPNAIVFGSGKVSIAQMARAGIWLNLIGIVIITALSWIWT